MNKSCFTVWIGLVIAAVLPAELAGKVRVYIKYNVCGGDETRAAQYQPVVKYFQKALDRELADKYPCVRTMDDFEIADLMNQLRVMLLTNPMFDRNDSYANNALQELGESVCRTEYLVAVDLGELPGGAPFIYARWIDVHKAEIMVGARTDPHGGWSARSYQGAVDEVVRALVSKLKKHEICPFKGTFKATVKTSHLKTKKEEYPVYCNGADAMYRKLTTDTAKAELYVEIQRIGKRLANVDGKKMRCSETRETDAVEENGCYTCPSGRQGRRTYTRNERTTLQIQGFGTVAYEDEAGHRLHHPAITLRPTFNEDGTYVVVVDVTSADGTESMRVEEHAEGPCDIISKPPETRKGGMRSFPLVLMLGPFKGDSQSKVLQEKQEQKSTDPNGDEVTTSFEFELQSE